jgi:hypothetical protein
MHPTNHNVPSGVMPEFTFYRDSETERQGGFLLAGILATDIPKGTPITPQQAERIEAVMQKLVVQVQTMPPDAVIDLWTPGQAPRNPFYPSPYGTAAEFGAWQANHLVISVRIEPPGADPGVLRLTMSEFAGLLRPRGRA